MEIFSLLEEAASQYPRELAVVDRFGALTYSELLQQTLDLKCLFEKYGVCPRMGVGFRVSNGRAFLAGLFAVSGLGAVVMPIDPNMRRFERELLAQEIPLHGTLEFSSTWSWTPGSLCPKDAFASFVPGAAVVRPTSGTTGKSKGVVLSHETVLRRVRATKEALAFSEADRIAWVLPMAQHFVVSLLTYVHAGAALLICDNHLAESIRRCCRERGATRLYAAPGHIQFLSESAEGPTDALDFKSVKHVYSTSAALSPAVARRFKERFGVPVRQLYGVIEVGLPLGNLSEPAAAVETVGTALLHHAAEVVNEAGEVCPDEVPGELVLRGPGIFDAYLSPPQRSFEILKDDWFYTGDIAVRHSAGVFEVLGRKKAVINAAGSKIHPEEVEAILERHPQVQAARVYGKAHSLLGQVVCAQIVSKLDQPVDTEALRQFCRKFLSANKIPQEIQQVAHLERTATGKLIRGPQS